MRLATDALAGRLDAAGAHRELGPARSGGRADRRGRRATGPVDEAQPAVHAGTGRPDGCCRRGAAVLVVDRVYLPELIGHAAFRLSAVINAAYVVWRHGGVVGNAVVVLDLLDGDEVGRPKVVDDEGRQCRELRLGIGRGEFSTLNVATDSSPGAGGTDTSR